METSVGISTRDSDTNVAAISGSAGVIQLVSLTSGKIDYSVGSPNRVVSSNDSLIISTISGNISIGDYGCLTSYIHHSVVGGSCLVTPLLCDDDGLVVGTLSSKFSQAKLGFQNSLGYFVSCNLNWDIRNSGAHKIYPHIYDLSSGNDIKIWMYTI